MFTAATIKVIGLLPYLFFCLVLSRDLSRFRIRQFSLVSKLEVDWRRASHLSHDDFLTNQVVDQWTSRYLLLLMFDRRNRTTTTHWVALVNCEVHSRAIE